MRPFQIISIFFIAFVPLEINGQECGLPQNAIRTTGFVQGVDTSVSKVNSKDIHTKKKKKK